MCDSSNTRAHPALSMLNCYNLEADKREDEMETSVQFKIG